MIPYSTCMRFASRDRRRRNAGHWTVCRSQIGQQGSTVVVETDAHGVVHVKVVECSEEDASQAALKRPPALSQSEYNLLQALDIGIDRPLTTTPFLTLYRRRERQPVLQPWSHMMNVLDDSYHGVAERLLARVDQWAFNTFALDACSGGRSMPLLCVHLFHDYGFLRTFNLDAVRVWHCFSLIDAGYHSNNPYHNSVHAADVTQAMHCFLLEDKIREHMTPLEAMASLIAAVTHDLDHPGVNQPFLIATSNHLAALYNNFSVLENHHWRSAVSCLRQSGIFDHLASSDWDEIEEQIRSLILATDITRQQEFLTRFKRYLENNVLDMADKEYRHFILQIALKCADLGNPCRPWDISHRWSLQVCKEFYRQGDFEKRLNIPVTPICDRERTTVAKIQADFFKFVVSPLFEIWDQFLDTPLSRELLRNLWLNHVQWQKKVAAADDSTAASGSFETDLNAPLASEEDEGDLLDGDDEWDDDEELPPLLRRRSATVTRYSWMEETLGSSAWGRRHSMPLSLPKLPSRTVIRRRRQSLPVAVAAAQEAAKAAGLQLPEERPASPALSAENLQPTTSLLSLSSTQEGAPISAVLQRVSRESERRSLVHQPTSYPPYRRTSEPFVATASKRAFPRRSESVFAFSSSMEAELGDGEDKEGRSATSDEGQEHTTDHTRERTTERATGKAATEEGEEERDSEHAKEKAEATESTVDAEREQRDGGGAAGDAGEEEEHAQEEVDGDRQDTSGSKTCKNGCGTPSPPPSGVTSPAGGHVVTRANASCSSASTVWKSGDGGNVSGGSPAPRPKSPAQTKRARIRAPAQLSNRAKATLPVAPKTSSPKATFTIEPPSSSGHKSKSADASTSVDDEAPMPSWSHRFSLTNEREAHQIEFDHPPEASWRNCTRMNNRRSSAPTALGLERQVSFLDEQGPMRMTGNLPETGNTLPPCALVGALRRRSSMPSEQQLVHDLSRAELVRLAAGSALARRPVQRELIRRHSIGFLEPVAPSSESEDGGSCATSTACSTRRGSCAPHHHDPRRRSSVSSRDEDETRDLFLPFVPAPAAASPGSLRRRRGSLPADVPLPLMVCATEKPQQQGGRRVVSRAGGAGEALDSTRRRGSTGEILSALIGPYGALHALQSLPRRGSGGGLELLSGLWRSRTLLGSDWSPGSSGAPPQPVSVAGRFKLQRQGCSLESTSGLQSTCSSAAGSMFSSSQRRGSFPQEFSLFSFSSGELYCCDDGGGD